MSISSDSDVFVELKGKVASSSRILVNDAPFTHFNKEAIENSMKTNKFILMIVLILNYLKIS